MHLPWCLRKCPYCDFNSHTARGALPESDYVAALLRDLDAELAALDEREVRSVYLGGGTPSLFGGNAVAALLDGIRARLPLAADAEITLEANPGAADAARFEGYLNAGVNRLSIGVQSFDDAALTRLGRIHDGAAARHSIEAAHMAGFANLNVDLMFALPGQILSGAVADARTAMELAPTHISAYQLTLEPGTAFHRSPPRLPDDDAAFDMQLAVERTLAEAGYERYEVSAYAQRDHQCTHNRNYWEFGDYLGIGAGAHGKHSAADGVRRTWKVRSPTRYLASAGSSAACGAADVPEAALGFEFMMNALRLKDGVPTALFHERTGLPLATIEEPLAAARTAGWLATSSERLRPTQAGYRFLDSMLQLFLVDSG